VRETRRAHRHSATSQPIPTTASSPGPDHSMIGSSRACSAVGLTIQPFGVGTYRSPSVRISVSRIARLCIQSQSPCSRETPR
jgi:hypothetical protein